MGQNGPLKKPDELWVGIRKSLPASLPKSTGQNGPLKGVKGERLAQGYDAVRHILLGIIWRKTAADPAASLLRFSTPSC